MHMCFPEEGLIRKTRHVYTPSASGMIMIANVHTTSVTLSSSISFKPPCSLTDIVYLAAEVLQEMEST